MEVIVKSIIKEWRILLLKSRCFFDFFVLFFLHFTILKCYRKVEFEVDGVIFL